MRYILTLFILSLSSVMIGQTYYGIYSNRDTTRTVDIRPDVFGVGDYTDANLTFYLPFLNENTEVSEAINIHHYTDFDVTTQGTQAKYNIKFNPINDSTFTLSITCLHQGLEEFIVKSVNSYGDSLNYHLSTYNWKVGQGFEDTFTFFEDYPPL